MMYKIKLIMFALLATAFFACTAYAQTAEDITAKCIFSAPCGTYYLRDSKLLDVWASPHDHCMLNIALPTDVTPGGVYIRWATDPKPFEFQQIDANGAVISSLSFENIVPMLSMFFPTDENAAALQFVLPATARILEINVYSEGDLPESTQIWNPPYEKADIMLLVAHQDDEELWFGGLIPYYDIVLEKNLSVVYMTNCSAFRKHEALAGLWAMGVRNYPIFLNYKDDYKSHSISSSLYSWGGQNKVLIRLQQLFDEVRPEVVVTHDIAGEYGHPHHCTVSYIAEEAIKHCGDFQVKKLYRHLGKTDLIHMDWDTPSERLGGLTPFEVARIGFEQHKSQHGKYNMEWSRKYDCTKFSLVFSLTGEDINKNDFLENIN